MDERARIPEVLVVNQNGSGAQFDNLFELIDSFGSVYGVDRHDFFTWQEVGTESRWMQDDVLKALVRRAVMIRDAS